MNQNKYKWKRDQIIFSSILFCLVICERSILQNFKPETEFVEERILNVKDLTCEFTASVRYNKSQRWYYARKWQFCYYLETLEFYKLDVRKCRVGIIGQKRTISHHSDRCKKSAEFRFAYTDKNISISKTISKLISQQIPPDSGLIWYKLSLQFAWYV